VAYGFIAVISNLARKSQGQEGRAGGGSLLTGFIIFYLDRSMYVRLSYGHSLAGNGTRTDSDVREESKDCYSIGKKVVSVSAAEYFIVR
jgi:hypothetical protein